MKAKYFTAENREAAAKMAAEYFGCDAGEITLEEISGGGAEGAPVQVLALLGTPEKISQMNAFFGLYYESDGVYLELYTGRGSGHPLDTEAVIAHLSRKNIGGLNGAAVQALISERSGRAKIAQAQQESIIGEDILVEIKSDEMEASAKLLAPEPGGANLDFETAKKKIQSAGVTDGLDEQALKELLEARDYGQSRVIAKATPYVDGTDGKLIFHFSTDERTGRPREIGGGRVDLRSLDLYVPVVEGQLLVTRISAMEGSPGVTVKGKVLKHKPGKEVNMPKAKNVSINEDRTEMHAMCSGMVEFINNTVNVSSVYKINGDCDISVGNIDFDGSVHVSGSVRSGNTIKATGAVVVGGVVEAATIIAGGNVEIKSGMQGADKGKIEAGGSVTALYIERGAVIADGSVNLDVSIHSVIEAGGSLVAKGKRGAIIGGRACAAGDVTANSIGALSQANTEIEVGVMPRKRLRIQTVENEIEKLKSEIVKLDQLDTYLEKSKEKMDPETWEKLYRSGAENRRLDEQYLEDYNEELTELKYELEHATEGKVHVFDTAFAGVKIIIGNGSLKIHDDIQYATFRHKDAEVVYGPCDLSKAK